MPAITAAALHKQLTKRGDVGTVGADKDFSNMLCDTVERAYELATSGEYPSVDQIVCRLKAEGHVSVLTALRSRTFRRELRALCSRTTLHTVLAD